LWNQTAIAALQNKGAGKVGETAMTDLASDGVRLRSMVARLNIEHFCKKLSEEINETKRQTLLQLVAEEKAKLFALLPLAVT
jgi:hypothetical protein